MNRCSRRPLIKLYINKRCYNIKFPLNIPILQQHPSSFPSSRTAVGVVRNSCRTKVSRSRTQFIQEENSKPKRSYSRQIRFWWLLGLCCFGAQRIYAGAPRSPPPMVILYRGGNKSEQRTFAFFVRSSRGDTRYIRVDTAKLRFLISVLFFETLFCFV